MTVGEQSGTTEVAGAGWICGTREQLGSAKTYLWNGAS